MPSCITAGGPAHAAGLAPGMIIKSIGGQQVTTYAELTNVLSNYSPGDDIRIILIEYNGYQMSERTVNLKLAAGAPIKEE